MAEQAAQCMEAVLGPLVEGVCSELVQPPPSSGASGEGPPCGAGGCALLSARVCLYGGGGLRQPCKRWGGSERLSQKGLHVGLHLVHTYPVQPCASHGDTEATEVGSSRVSQ